MAISSGAMLDLNGEPATIGAPSGAGTVTSSHSGTLNLTLMLQSGATSTFSGVIQNVAVTGTSTINLIVSGTGTEVLAGINTYGGSTTINTPPPCRSATATPARSAAPRPSPTTACWPSILPVRSTFANAVSGSGRLMQMGSSLLLLSGSNYSYTGPTTIASGGTLQFGNGGTINSGTIDTSSVADGGLLVLSFSSNLGIGAAISGSGGLTQAGTNLLTLTGSNTYAGPTTINSGTLQIGSGGAAGSIGNTSGVADNGLVAFDVSGTTTFSPPISGSGASTQMSGLLVLTGSNTYAGLTTISNGTLQIGSGGASGSINGTSGVSLGSFGSMLAFDLSGTTTFSQTISGSGGLTQMGPGLLILTGSDTYTNTTTISGGTLQIGNGSSGSISSTNNVTDNGLLAFDLAAGTTTFSPTISGSGGLAKWPPLC